jgi:hypothetical protein
MWVQPAAVALLMVLTISCSPRRLMVHELTAAMSVGVDVMERDGDLHLSRQALPAHITMLEGMLASDPHHAPLKILLARLYASYAFAVLETDLEAARLTAADPGEIARLGALVRRYYHKGGQLAWQVLAHRYPTCSDNTASAAATDACMADMTSDDVPALFWYGFNLAGFIDHNRDSVRAMAAMHRVTSAMHRVVELEPGFYHSGAHLVLMVYYGSRSALMGGDPEAAVTHYRRVKALQGDSFLLPDVFYARHILYHRQDRRKFFDVLTAVSEHANGNGGAQLLNRVAVERANVYLHAQDRFFQ